MPSRFKSPTATVVGEPPASTSGSNLPSIELPDSSRKLQRQRSESTIYAVNPDGTRKWAFVTGDWIGSSAAIDEAGNVFVGSYDKKLYALAPDGSLRWSFTTADRILSSPALGSDSTIYVGSMDGMLYAVNPNGTQKWSFQTIGFVQSSPALPASVGGYRVLEPPTAARASSSMMRPRHFELPHRHGSARCGGKA